MAKIVELGDGPTVLDLFCGAGGLSLGFASAGFRVLHAIDHNQAAVSTYKHNFGSHVLCTEINEMTELPQADIIVGGPPCQGFSSAGTRQTADHRNTLVGVFAQLVVRQRPRAFLFENVEGFLTAESGNRVFDLLCPLIATGYRIHIRKVNAANYGVPQHRKRVIAVGGLGWEPNFPEPTHRAFGAPGADLIARDKPLSPTLRQALDGLLTPTEIPPGVPQGHYYTPLDPEDLKRVQLLKPGQTMRDLPQELWHPSYRRRAFRRVMDGTPTECRGGAPAGVRRLVLDEPAKAITGGARSEFIHPIETRNLTLRECARIQTFPDDFEFVGTTTDQTKLIGNAVPPRLAFVFAHELSQDIRTAQAAKGHGGLLTFVPTSSNGMSPALEQVTKQVLSIFSNHAINGKQLGLWR